MTHILVNIQDSLRTMDERITRMEKPPVANARIFQPRKGACFEDKLYDTDEDDPPHDPQQEPRHRRRDPNHRGRYREKTNLLDKAVPT